MLLTLCWQNYLICHCKITLDSNMYLPWQPIVLQSFFPDSGGILICILFYFGGISWPNIGAVLRIQPSLEMSPQKRTAGRLSRQNLHGNPSNTWDISVWTKTVNQLTKRPSHCFVNNKNSQNQCSKYPG